MLRSLGRLLGLACALLLGACTGAPLMGLEVSDYRETFSWTGDQQLLTEILRAKDNAPLHFTELQTLGASNQYTASLQATSPIGSNASGVPGSLQGTAGAQTSPTLSLSSLEVQQFTQGLLSPIGPQVIQQFLEEGIDRRLIFILFFAGFQKGGITYYNNLKCDFTDKLMERRCHDNFYFFLENVDKIGSQNKKIVARTYVELTPMGTSVPWAGTKISDIAGIDANRYNLIPDPRDPTKGIVYSVSEQRLALCYVSQGPEGGVNSFPVVDANPAVCRRDKVPVSRFRTNAQAGNGLIVRSTYEVIEYLGQILSFQEQQKADGLDRCVTLSGRPGHRTCEDDVLFQVNPPRGSRLVSTTYNGTVYTINTDLCYDPLSCDHSAEVLKMVNLLVNYAKSAAIIPQVPAVRIVP